MLWVAVFVHIFILLAGVAFSKWLMAIKDPHHHDLFDPDKSGGGGSFSEFVGGQAGISPCHRSRHQRDDRQPQAAAVPLIVWTFSKEWEDHYLSSWERTKCKVTDLNDDCGTSNCQQKDGMMIIIQDDGADCEDDDRNGRRWVESLFELGAASSPTVLRTQYLQTIPTLVIILVIVVLSAFSSLHSFRLTSCSHWKFSPPLAGSVWWGKLF